MLKAGALFPIGYAAYDQEIALFIRAHVFNITSGLPVVVGTTDLVHEGFGAYSGRFVGGGNGDLYSVVSVVYTDGTYATPEPTRSPGKNELQFVDLGASVAEAQSPGEFLAISDGDEELLATLECEGA